MRVKLQLVMCTDDGLEETVTDVATLQKDSQRIEQLGLTLAEAKQLLTSIRVLITSHRKPPLRRLPKGLHPRIGPVTL
jgi:dsDNA-binding SOS-regulon protein